MYSHSAGLGVAEPEKVRKNIWRQDRKENRSFTNGKQFVQCICPKCTDVHSVYMLWTGRGVPRKYCSNCKPLISGYDDATIYEVAIYAPGHSKKKGRRNEGE